MNQEQNYRTIYNQEIEKLNNEIATATDEATKTELEQRRTDIERDRDNLLAILQQQEEIEERFAQLSDNSKEFIRFLNAIATDRSATESNTAAIVQDPSATQEPVAIVKVPSTTQEISIIEKYRQEQEIANNDVLSPEIREAANRVLSKSQTEMTETILREIREIERLKREPNTIENQEKMEQIESTITQLQSLLSEENRAIIRQEQERIEESHADQGDTPQEIEEKNMLAPGFNPNGMTYDDFVALYKKQREEFEEKHDEESIQKITNIYNDIEERRKKEPENENFYKDLNGNVVYYDGTMIPTPRLRKINVDGTGKEETQEEYNRYLNEVYGPLLSKEGYFSKATEPSNKKTVTQPTTPEKELPSLPPGTRKEYPALPPGKEKELPALPKGKELPALPAGQEDEPTKTNPEPTPEPKKRVRTLEEILDYVKRNKDGKPLRIKGKTGKRLKAANIQVTKSFSEELHSGNWLYNVIHVAPAVVGLAIKGAKKLIAKFNLWRTDQKHVEKEIRDRINELSEEELDVVRREYRGQRVIEDLKTPSVVKDLLREKIAVEDARKTVAGINQRISANYQTLLATFNGVQAIDKQLADKSLSAEKREALTAQRAALLKGKADLVHETRELYIQGNDELSGGAHGFSEDVKASESKMNLQGKRFAKVPDYDETTAELQEALAKLSRREKDACETHDDEAALRAFVETETLKSKETEISNSILGKRSTGRMYYSPLVGELDYRDDPFIRDLFSTVALVGAGVSAANAIRTHVTETPKVVDEHNAQVDAVNAHNQDTMSQVHQAGQGIYDKADVFRKGQEAQAQQDVVNFGNTGERMSLDSSAIEAGGDWGHGLGTSFYRNADDAQHAMTESIYNETQTRISDIGSRYATGELDQLAALQEVGKVAADSQQTLTSLVEQYRPVLEQYASTHPQFELGAMQSGLEFISQNPTAIIDMNQAMVDTVQMGQSLTGLTVEEVQALQNLPSDLQTTLIGAATAAGLAFKTASTMDQRYAKRTGYGNDLTDMVEDFVAEQEEKETVRSK